jgi:alcohol dehydrogenase (cytochrome c)
MVIGGAMYFTTDTMTYAMDAASCRLRWKQRTPYPPTYLTANRGVAFDNLLVVGSVDWCFSVLQLPPDSAHVAPGAGWSGDTSGGFGTPDSTSKWQGWITAVDADSGTVRWRHRTIMPMLGGVTVTAGGVVLAGELTGDVIALDARNGTPLWRQATGNAIGGGVITYQSGGKQYVAVAAGMKALSGR